MILLVLATFPRVAEAQTNGSGSLHGTASSRYETRAQLEAEAALLERKGRTGDAWLRRSRLEKGDFQEGDRLVVIIEAGPVVAGAGIAKDTLTVRAGKVLQLARMGDLSLEGTLRSELSDALQAHVAKYLKNPVVRAMPLLSIAVTGSVGAPGYYYAPADFVLRDVVMMAGGPSGTADLNKVVIRRGGEIIWKASDVRIALSDGLSLDRLHLRAGDAVYVPERRQWQWSTLAMIASTTTSLALLLANSVR